MTFGQVLAFLVLVACFILWLVGGMTLPIAFGCIAALALILGGYKIGSWGAS